MQNNMNIIHSIFILTVLMIATVAVMGKDQPPPLSRQVADRQVDRQSNYEYVGTKRCRMCHTKQYDFWRDTAKANAFESLKPGVKVVAKRNAGLDANRDYTTDPTCLSCHTVGYGEAGGYEIPDPDDQRMQRRVKSREGVGCESCHGPGSGFIEVMQDISRNDRPYRPSEVYAAGRQIATVETCQKCHNKRAVCITDHKKFRVEPSNRKSFHQKIPFQFRLED